MSTKPQSIKPKQVHHAQKETHKLLPLDVATLIQISEAQQQLQSAKINILTRIAQTQLKYPAGHVLEFLPDIENGELTVIMKGEAKSEKSLEQAINNSTKE